jgi:hypothetical protein
MGFKSPATSRTPRRFLCRLFAFAFFRAAFADSAGDWIITAENERGELTLYDLNTMALLRNRALRFISLATTAGCWF